MPTTESPSTTGTAPIRYWASRSTTALTISAGRAETTGPVRPCNIAAIVISCRSLRSLFHAHAIMIRREAEKRADEGCRLFALGLGPRMVHVNAEGHSFSARRQCNRNKRLGAARKRDV